MLHAVIPAGGSGTRLWPLSRAANPKFLHMLTGTEETLDHLIGDTERLTEVLTRAVAGAQQGLLITVGITPTSPETGYGYLQCGDVIEGPVRRVAQFKEKPSLEVAAEYVEAGCLWNAGMFVWRVDVFLAELQRQQPELHAGLLAIAAAWESDRDRAMAEIWPTLKKISVDFAVMEGAAQAGLVAAVPGDFGWTDVGDFHTLGEVLERDEHGNVVLGDGKAEVLLNGVTDSVIVPRSGRLVAVLGLDDLVVADTPDAVLVCHRDRAQDVKQIVEQLKQRGDTRV